MVRTSRVAPCLFLLAFVMSLLSMGLDAGSFSQLDELFQNIDRQSLKPEQRIAIRALRNRIREEQLQMPAPLAGHSHQFVDEFILCASGVLDDQQFHKATGTLKNPQQQLRYEIRQLHAEIIRLQRLTRSLNR